LEKNRNINNFLHKSEKFTTIQCQSLGNVGCKYHQAARKTQTNWKKEGRIRRSLKQQRSPSRETVCWNYRFKHQRLEGYGQNIFHANSNILEMSLKSPLVIAVEGEGKPTKK